MHMRKITLAAVAAATLAVTAPPAMAEEPVTIGDYAVNVATVDYAADYAAEYVAPIDYADSYGVGSFAPRFNRPDSYGVG